jgi:UTP--glucose-1-phosphate uridylyltransferase
VPGGDTSFTDVGRWRWYNTNNIWIDLRALKNLQTADPAARALPLSSTARPSTCATRRAPR